MFQIHLLAGGTEVKLKSGPFVKITINGDPGHISIQGITPVKNIPDQSRLRILADDGHKEVGPVIQYLDVCVFSSLHASNRLLLGEIPVPLSQFPDLIIQFSIDLWQRKIPDMHGVIYPFVAEE